ncbi:MAG: hypothetical protein ACRCZQ_10530 [Bacteroidales bacterium]
MNIGKWALSNSKLVYFLVATLIVGGLYSYDRMSKLEDPEVNPTLPLKIIFNYFQGLFYDYS